MYAAILDQAKKIIGNGGYTPDRWCNKKLPFTMRDLIENQWPAAEEPVLGIANPAVDFLMVPPRLKRSNVPIAVTDIKRQCPPPVTMVDCRGWKTILTSYWNWLPETVRRRIRVDHPLSQTPWPLADHLNKRLMQKYGTDLDQLLFLGDYEPADFVRSTDHVMIPCYDLEYSGDEVVMIEFLECSIRPAIKYGDFSDFHWPEVVLEAVRESERDKGGKIALDCLHAILKKHRFELLPKIWQKACRALDAYPHWPIGIYFESYEYGGWHEPVETAKQLGNVFDILEKVFAMRQGVWSVLEPIGASGCPAGGGYSDCLPVFDKLIDHLLRVAQRHPELKAKPKRKQKRARKK